MLQLLQLLCRELPKTRAACATSVRVIAVSTVAANASWTVTNATSFIVSKLFSSLRPRSVFFFFFFCECVFFVVVVVVVFFFVRFVCFCFLVSFFFFFLLRFKR